MHPRPPAWGLRGWVGVPGGFACPPVLFRMSRAAVGSGRCGAALPKLIPCDFLLAGAPLSSSLRLRGGSLSLSSPFSPFSAFPLGSFGVPGSPELSEQSPLPRRLPSHSSPAPGTPTLPLRNPGRAELSPPQEDAGSRAINNLRRSNSTTQVAQQASSGHRYGSPGTAPGLGPRGTPCSVRPPAPQGDQNPAEGSLSPVPCAGGYTGLWKGTEWVFFFFAGEGAWVVFGEPPLSTAPRGPARLR